MPPLSRLRTHCHLDSHSAIDRWIGVLASNERRQQNPDSTRGEFVIRLFDFAKFPPAMTDDVPVGADGLDLGFVHSGDEEALVLVHLTPLPLENMAACPDPLVHSQPKPRLLVELTLGGAFELQRLVSRRCCS